MNKLYVIIFSCILLLSCHSVNENLNTRYLTTYQISTINSFIDDSVDSFSIELGSDGGYFMWKNYRDYLGLSNVGFKERIHEAWTRAYDDETLEVYLNTQLSKKYKIVTVKVDKNTSAIDNYWLVLFLPFLTFALEEVIIWLLLLALIEWVVIPYVAKRIISSNYNTRSFWKNIVLNIVSNAVRQQKIKECAQQARKVINFLLLAFLFIFNFFYFDFNESLNKSLKNDIRSRIWNSITIRVNDK